MSKKFPTLCGNVITPCAGFFDHMKAHPIPMALLKEAIAQITLPQTKLLKVTVDMQRIIGRSEKVETQEILPDTPSLFATRHNRRGPSRVTVFREPVPTSMLTLVAGTSRKEDIGKKLFLYTAFCGDMAELEPWDKAVGARQFMISLRFWCRNALVYDPSQYSEQPYESTWEEVMRNISDLKG